MKEETKNDEKTEGVHVALDLEQTTADRIRAVEALMGISQLLITLCYACQICCLSARLVQSKPNFFFELDGNSSIKVARFLNAPQLVAKLHP